MFSYVNIFISTEGGIAKKLLHFKIKFVCYLQPVDYLDMGNLSTYFAYKNRIADIHNKLYSITSKLKKTASSIGFVNKAIYHNVISQFAQIEGQFLNRHEHTQGSTYLLETLL